MSKLCVSAVVPSRKAWSPPAIVVVGGGVGAADVLVVVSVGTRWAPPQAPENHTAERQRAMSGATARIAPALPDHSVCALCTLLALASAPEVLPIAVDTPAPSFAFPV